MQGAQALDRGPWLQMYMLLENCTPLRRQTTEGSSSWVWQAGGGSFLLLPGRHALSSLWLWAFDHNTEQWSDRSAMLNHNFRSTELLARLGIEYLDLILKERRLRWYGHVERSNGAVKTAFDIQIVWKRGPGRPKMTWKQLKAWAWEAQDDLEAADREGFQRVEALSYRPSW